MKQVTCILAGITSSCASLLGLQQWATIICGSAENIIQVAILIQSTIVVNI